MQRQKKVEELKKAGKGTPITPESFAAWQERKRKQRADAAKKKVEVEMKKKKGGKGLSVLSGRELFDYKKELFDDRDDDDDDDSGGGGGGGEDNDTKPAATTIATATENGAADTGRDVEQVAAQVQTELFLEGDDEDLDDLEDD